MRSIFAGTKNFGGEKPCRGQSPNTVFRSPSRRQAAKQLQSCYAPVFI